MATTTSGNLHLTKPAYADGADIATINSNMDTIDTNFTSLNSSLTNVQSTINKTITWLSQTSDADNCTDATKVYAWGGISFTNSPGIYYARMIYMPGAAPAQIAMTNDGATIATRINTGTWSSWSTLATASDLENLRNLDNTTATYIGKWTDGTSNLYRRVIESDMLSDWTMGTEKTIATLSTRMSIKRIDAMLYTSTDGSCYTTGDYFRVYYRGSTGNIIAWQNATSYSAKVIITIEYVA